MRIKKNPDLIMRSIAGECVLIPTGELAAKFNGMITLNATAQFIWDHMEEISSLEEMTALLLDAFEVDEETAARDVRGFIATAIHVGYATDEDKEE